jgi:uncharacterized protein
MNLPLFEPKVKANSERASKKERQMGVAIITKQDLLKVLHQNREPLKALGVSRIGLFGSIVRGEQNPDSDIDLLVEFKAGKKTFDAFMELSFLVEEILQRRIELVTVESLSPYIGPHIVKEVEYVALAA